VWNVCFEELLADALVSESGIEGGGLDLGVQSHRFEATVAGHRFESLHKCSTDVSITVRRPYRDTFDLASFLVGSPKPSRPDGVDTVIRDEMNRVRFVFVDFEISGDVLFLDEDSGPNREGVLIHGIVFGRGLNSPYLGIHTRRYVP